MVGSETNIVGNRSGSVADIFATPTLAALLTEFALLPDHTFIQKELVSRTGGSLYLVQRELKRLERAGLVVRQQRGRQVEYRYNGKHPAAAGIRDAVLRSVGLADYLAAALSDVPGVELAFIFGSLASGTDRPESDIDILVVGALSTKDVASRMMPVVRDLDREPNIVVLDATDLRTRLRSKDHFIGEVMSSPRVWLVGDDDELATLVG